MWDTGPHSAAKVASAAALVGGPRSRAGLQIPPGAWRRRPRRRCTPARCSRPKTEPVALKPLVRQRPRLSGPVIGGGQVLARPVRPVGGRARRLTAPGKWARETGPGPVIRAARVSHLRPHGGTSPGAAGRHPRPPWARPCCASRLRCTQSLPRSRYPAGPPQSRCRWRSTNASPSSLATRSRGSAPPLRASANRSRSQKSDVSYRLR